MTRGWRRLLKGEVERDNSWGDAAIHGLTSPLYDIKRATRKNINTEED